MNKNNRDIYLTTIENPNYHEFEDLLSRSEAGRRNIVRFITDYRFYLFVYLTLSNGRVEKTSKYDWVNYIQSCA